MIHKYETETLSAENISDSSISIDSIHFTWQMDNVTMSTSIGMIFDTLDTATGKTGECQAHALAAVKEGSDTSFYFYTKDRNRQMLIKPGETMVMKHFRFGRCVLCAGVSSIQLVAAVISIKTIFVNNQAGRDTVIFTGVYSDLISTGSTQEKAAYFRISKESPLEEHSFLASGRKVTILRETNNRRMIPFNLYFTKHARVPINVNSISK